MSNAKLSIARPTEINPEAVLSFVHEVAAKTVIECQEIEERFKFMKLQHQSLANLMEEAQSLKVREKAEGLTGDETEELGEILDAAIDIMESIQRVANNKSLLDDSVSIDEIGADLNLNQEIDGYNAKFITAYNKHKARLGLKTQEDVAKLTGLDRRYISNIENQKYRPQFKTIKRIADAFGADISEFM